MSKRSFSCNMCGHCCHGEGGIIVGPKDLPRLLEYFQLEAQNFFDTYTINTNGKPCIITREDKYCIFFDEKTGCTIHAVRPDVCRGWPFFRGNLVDEQSFEMAKLDCPGISKDVAHTTFAHEGYAYLVEHQLIKTDPQTDGRALIIKEEDLPPKE